MSHRDGISSLRCPNCGLYCEKLEIMFPVLFPNDYLRYAFSIKSASENSICLQCNKPIPYSYRIYSFVFLPTKKILNYIPKQLSKQEISAYEKFEIEKLGNDFVIISSNDMENVKCEAFKTLLSLVKINYHGKCGIVADTLERPLDVLSPKNLRNKDYHVALFVLTFPPLNMLDPSGATDTGNSVPRDQASRYQQKLYDRHIFDSFFELCERIGMSQSQFDPMMEIEKLFIPESFNQEIISTVSEIVSKVTGHEGDYIYYSLLAAASSYSHQTNPLSDKWIKEIIRMLMLNKLPTRLKLTPEHLHQMMSANELYKIISMMGLLQNDKFNAVMDIANRFGYEEEFSRLYTNSTYVSGLDESKVSPLKLVTDVVGFARNKYKDDLSVGIFLGMVVSSFSNEEYRLKCFESVMDKYSKTNPDLVIPLLQKIAKKLIGDGSPSLALDLITTSLEETNVNILNPLSVVRILTEKGNVQRANFDYNNALTTYQSIASIIGQDLLDENVRMNERNIALVLRDTGKLTNAKQILWNVLVYARCKERFDCLYALGIAHQMNGEYEAAQRIFDEAKELIKYAPIDNQIAAFFGTEFSNRSLLKKPIIVDNLLEVIESNLVSSRIKLMMLGVLGTIIFGRMDHDPKITRFQDKILHVASQKDFKDMAKTDPSCALQWTDTLLNIGKKDLSKKMIDTILLQNVHPRLLVDTAIKGADLTVKNCNIDETIFYIKKAYQEMVRLVKTAESGDLSIGIADTLTSIRSLGSYLNQLTAHQEIKEIISTVADLQCSLRLSIDLASEHVPFSTGKNSSLLPEILLESTTSYFQRPIQMLQFLDADDYQIPILTKIENNKVTIEKGDPVDTSLLREVSETVSFKMARMTSNSMADPFEGLSAYDSFRKNFLKATEGMGLNKNIPLLTIPSQAVLGIPFHHIFYDCPLAYVPSISMFLALSVKAHKELKRPAKISEVISWTFGQKPKLVEIMHDGSRELRDICNRFSTPYTSLEGVNATKQNVQRQIEQSSWIKFTCHGMANSDLGRFGFVLSDGKQDPPSLEDLLYNEDLSLRYLYAWEEISTKKGACKVLFSTACSSASSTATIGGEQIGLARSFFRTGVLSYIGPLWPVGGRGSQSFINGLMQSCLSKPETPLIYHVYETRKKLLGQIPPYIIHSFVLHGYHGPLIPQNSK